MNVRLKKEFQNFFWPWLAVTLIGLLPLVTFFLRPLGLKLSIHFAQSIATSSYLLGVTLLAAMLFGIEFQQRTFPLLLSQPYQKKQIWRDKISAAAIAILILSVVHAVGCLYNREALNSDLRPAVVLIPSLFCAAIFGSLITRSVLGGVVFSIFSLAAMRLVSVLIEPSLRYYYLPFDIVFFIAPASAPLFLWLSWCHFRHLEISSDWNNETKIQRPTKSTQRSILDFQSHARRPLLNLVLKELRLLRPVFLIMLLFTILWIASVAGAIWRPVHTDAFNLIMEASSILYLSLVILGAGCVSLGKEKSLGIHTLNLASPVSSTIQWLVKNVVATLTGLSGTVLLVVLLSYLTGQKLDFLPIKIGTEPFYLLLLVSLLVIVLIQISFWAATVADRTTHAIFLAVAVAIGLFFAFSFSARIGQEFERLPQWPVYWLVAHFQLSQVFLGEWFGLIVICSLLAAGATVIFPGLACFRRLHSEQRNLKTALFIPLAAIVVAGVLSGAVGGCLSPSAFKNSSLYQETEAALISLKANVPKTNETKPRKITYTELLATGKLSPRTQIWLQNCNVYISQHGTSDELYIMALVYFPKTTWIHPISLSPKAEKELPAIRESIRKNHANQPPQ
jgi:hypothetical protein